MNWLLAQPLIILVAGAVIELVLLAVLHQTGKYWVLWAMVAVAVLFTGLIAVERLVVTPEEAIRATLYEIASEAEKNDVQAVVGHISSRAHDLKSRAQRRLEFAKFDEVKIKKISDLKVLGDQQPPTATVHVRALAVGGDRSGTIQNFRTLREFDVWFVLEDDAWKVSDYKDVGRDLLRP